MTPVIPLTMFYVSLDGDDAWSGSLPEPDFSGQDGPLRTVQAVAGKLRQLVQQGLERDVQVWIRGGTYYWTEPLILTREEWQSQTHSLVIEAYPGERPVLSSGIRLSGWRKLEDSATDLTGAARNRVWVADIPAELAGRKLYSLFQGERSLPRASSEGFVPVQLFERNGENWATEDKSTLHFPPGQMRAYVDLKEMELVIRPTFQWVFNRLPLLSVDEEGCIAHTAIPGTYPLKRIINQPRITESCWLENGLAFLSRPGEWVAHSQDGKLYYWPDGDAPEEDLFVPALQEFVRLEGDEGREIPIRGIELRGLTFTHGERDTWTETDAGLLHDWDMYDKANALVRLRWAERCVVEKCRFTCSGGSAIRLDLYAKGNRVMDNEIAHMGGTGLLLCGFGPGTKDVNQANIVERNHIHHCGESYWHAPAIFVWQSGYNRIAHNRIHNMPYSGIVLSGVRDLHLRYRDLRECSRSIRWEELGDLPETIQSWEQFVPYMHARGNVVEGNEISAVMEKLGDGNAIYLSGAGDHNYVCGNYIHDIVDCHMQSAIRVDDFQRHTHIVGNVIHRCCGGGITLKHLNYVENNIIADLQPVRGVDGTLSEHKEYILLRRGPSEGSTIQRNVLYKTSAAGAFYQEGKGPHPEWVKHCLTDCNLYWCAANPLEGEELLKRNKRDGIDGGGLCADPLFVDAAAGDFRLLPGSPVFQLGFVPVSNMNPKIKESSDEFHAGLS